MSPSSSCQQCVRLLKKVLAQENSRPMTILEALGSTNEVEDEGTTSIKLRVPRPKNGLVKQWEDLKPPDESNMDEKPAASFSAKIKPMIATSSASTTSGESSLEPLKIECRPCADTGPERGARAFVMGPTPLSIVLCSNRLSLVSTDEMEQVLVHELMHVYDVRVNQLDLRSCENLAYSEVRAAREAECKTAWLASQYCIPEKSFRATSNLFPPDVARACLSKVFAAALKDTAPLQNTRPPSKISHQNTSTTTNNEVKNLKRRATCHLGGTAPASDR